MARACSSIADARVEIRVRKIHQQVDQHEEDGDDQHGALHDRVVARKNGVHDQPAHPGHAKIVSVRIAPPSRLPTFNPMTVTTGMNAFFSAWRETTRCSVTPFARAVRT